MRLAFGGKGAGTETAAVSRGDPNPAVGFRNPAAARRSLRVTRPINRHRRRGNPAGQRRDELAGQTRRERDAAKDGGRHDDSDERGEGVGGDFFENPGVPRDNRSAGSFSPGAPDLPSRAG